MSSKDLDYIKWIIIMFPDLEAQASCRARWPQWSRESYPAGVKEPETQHKRECGGSKSQKLLQPQLLTCFQIWEGLWSACQNNNTYSSQREQLKFWWLASTHACCLRSVQKLSEVQCICFLHCDLEGRWLLGLSPQWHDSKHCCHKQQVRNAGSQVLVQTQWLRLCILKRDSKVFCCIFRQKSTMESK